MTWSQRLCCSQEVFSRSSDHHDLTMIHRIEDGDCSDRRISVDVFVIYYVFFIVTMKWLTPENTLHVQILWNYMQLHQTISPVDVIILPWNSDVSYMPYVINLYHQWFAPHIICSGKGSPYMGKSYTESEAEHYAGILINWWVPQDSIVLEDQATSTGENMRFSYEICEKNQRNNILIIQKPFFERRLFATAYHETSSTWRKAQHIIISSMPCTIDEYDTINTLPLDWIQSLVWDIHRIKVCTDQWWIAPQVIPDDVQKAYLTLVQLWYDQLLMKGYPVW